jgi:hypothetical protein
MNNGDIINDDVILSLEDGRDLMKKMLRKLCQRGRWRDRGGVCYFAVNNVSSPQNAGTTLALVIVTDRVFCCVLFADLFGCRTCSSARLPESRCGFQCFTKRIE